MSLDAQPCPGMGRMVCGAGFLTCAAGATSSWSQDPGRILLFQVVVGALGTALLLWGWSRLRQAKAARLGVTWWQFLQIDPVAAGVAVVLVASLVAIPAEQRQRLDRSLREFSDLLREIVDVMHIAKGHP